MRAQDKDRKERQGVHLVGLRMERADFAVREQATSDYGIDAIAELIEDERATGRLVALQVKAGPSYFKEMTDASIIYRPSGQHVEYWLSHTLPVLVCLCDLEDEVVYWQRVARDTLESTGKGIKLEIPRTHVLDANVRPLLIDTVTPRVASSDYTIVRTEDVSHGLAKRYSIRVVLNRSMTKPELAAVVRDLTAKTAKRRYSRNKMVRGQWGDSDAHVVWTYLYASAADEKQSSYTCRSLWIDPNLDPSHAPMPLTGEDVGDGIIVDWHESPLTGLATGKEHDFSKEHYLDLIDPLVEAVGESLRTIRVALEQWRGSEGGEGRFLAATSSARSQIEQAYESHAQSPQAPFECSDLDAPVGTLLGFADNIVLFHNPTGIEKWTAAVRQTMTASALGDADKALDRVKYEREKVA